MSKENVAWINSNTLLLLLIIFVASAIFLQLLQLLRFNIRNNFV